MLSTARCIIINECYYYDCARCCCWLLRLPVVVVVVACDDDDDDVAVGGGGREVFSAALPPHPEGSQRDKWVVEANGCGELIFLRFAFADSDLLFSGFDGLTHASGISAARGDPNRTATRQQQQQLRQRKKKWGPPVSGCGDTE